MQFFNLRALIFASATLAVYLATTWRTKPAQLDSNLDPILFNTTSQSQSCAKLALTLLDSVYTHQHHDFRRLQRSAYSAQAQEDTPACIVRPKTAEDVSKIIRVLEADPNASFVVRSGGHRPGSGHSSIRGGVLIDLGRINEVSVSEDRTSVSIGTGAKWGEVYEQLDVVGLSVAGGRNADVGVGGLVLGGAYRWAMALLGVVATNTIAVDKVVYRFSRLRSVWFATTSFRTRSS